MDGTWSSFVVLLLLLFDLRSSEPRPVCFLGVPRIRGEERGRGASERTIGVSSSDVSDTTMRSGETAAEAAELVAVQATSTGAAEAEAASSPDAMTPSRGRAGAGGRAS